MKSHCFFKSYRFHCKRTLYTFINPSTFMATQQIINIQKPASRKAGNTTHFVYILTTVSLLSNNANITEVCEQSFFTFILSERWTEYYSKSTVNSLYCWEGKETIRLFFCFLVFLFVLLHTEERPIGRKVINEIDVSLGRAVY